jgi:hypothetical protein
MTAGRRVQLQSSQMDETGCGDIGFYGRDHANWKASVEAQSRVYMILTNLDVCCTAFLVV